MVKTGKIMQKEYHSLDIMKFLMAIVVVAIHTNPFVNVRNENMVKYIMLMEDTAVPFYFIASGFLLSAGWGEHADRLSRVDRTLKNTTKLYVIWTAIYIPWAVYGYIISGHGVLSCLASYCKYFLFVGKLYNSYHLWYLLAMIYALLMIRLLVKKEKSPLYILTIGIIFFAFYLIMNYLGKNVNDIEFDVIKKIVNMYLYIFNAGGIFSGLFYMAIGICIYEFNIALNPMLCIGCIVFASFFYQYQLLTAISTAIVTVMLFVIIIQIKLPYSQIYSLLRNSSKYIYLVHLFLFGIYTYTILKKPNQLGFISFIVTVCSSIFISFIIMGIKALRK